MTAISQSAVARTPQEILIKRISDILSAGINVTSTGGGSSTFIGNGRKTVAVVGVAEALDVSTECTSVTIQAEFNNTGIIVVGDSSVIADEATRVGLALSAEDSVTIAIDDLAKIYLDTTVATDGVTFVYFK